ncbi:hypothetical protein ES703_83567 [subsurface metagenome]
MALNQKSMTSLRNNKNQIKKALLYYKFCLVLTPILNKYKQKKRLQKHLTRYNFPIGLVNFPKIIDLKIKKKNLKK